MTAGGSVRWATWTSRVRPSEEQAETHTAVPRRAFTTAAVSKATCRTARAASMQELSGNKGAMTAKQASLCSTDREIRRQTRT